MRTSVIVWFGILLLLTFSPSVFASPSLSVSGGGMLYIAEDGLLFIRELEGGIIPFVVVDGLEIVYPKNIYYPFDEDLDLSFQLFDGKGDLLVDGVDCGISFYDINGSNFYSGVLLSDGDDWIISLGSGFSSSIGFIPYNVDCVASNGSDSFAGGYFVTSDGKENSGGAGLLLGAIVFIPLLFSLFMLVGAATMSQDHSVLRIFFFLLSPLLVFTSFHFSMIGIVKYFGLFELQEAIAGTTYWMAWLFFVLLSYFMSFFIWKWADYIVAKKKDGNAGVSY